VCARVRARMCMCVRARARARILFKDFTTAFLNTIARIHQI